MASSHTSTQAKYCLAQKISTGQGFGLQLASFCLRKFKNSKSVVWRPLQLRNGCALKSRGRIVESIYFTIKGHLHKPLCRVFFSLISNLYKYSPQESSMGGANGKTLHTSTSKTASISFLACHCIHAGKWYFFFDTYYPPTPVPPVYDVHDPRSPSLKRTPIPTPEDNWRQKAARLKAKEVDPRSPGLERTPVDYDKTHGISGMQYIAWVVMAVWVQMKRHTHYTKKTFVQTLSLLWHYRMKTAIRYPQMTPAPRCYSAPLSTILKG